jgi:hypothetical protein
MTELTADEMQMYTDWYKMMNDAMKEHSHILPDMFVMHLGEGASGEELAKAISGGNPSKVEIVGHKEGAKYTAIPLKSLVEAIMLQTGDIRETLSAARGSGSGDEFAKKLLMKVIQKLTYTGKADYAMLVLGAWAPVRDTNSLNDFGRRREVVIFTIERRDGTVWYAEAELSRTGGKPVMKDEPPKLKQYNGEEIGLLHGMFEKKGSNLMSSLDEMFG